MCTVCRCSRDSFTDSCLLPDLSHRQITGIPYPDHINHAGAPQPPSSCVLASRSARSHLCAHTCLFSRAGCLKPEVTTLSVIHRVSLTLNPPQSLSLPLISSLLSPLFFKYFYSWGLCRWNVTLYLLLHLVTAGDSCTYFWSAARVNAAPSQHSMLTMALSGRTC